MGEQDLWQAVLYLHLVSMAFFLGGQLALGVVIVPVEGDNPDRERMRGMGRRFGIGSLVTLAILLVTGIALAGHYDLWDSGTLRLKLVLVAIVAGLVLAHLRWPRAHALQGAILLGTAVIAWLGLELVV